MKFRAWIIKRYFTEKDKTFEEIVEGSMADIKIISLNSNKVFFEDQWWHEFILMQYTGSKDKNGKEIYEGDIVKWKGECLVVKYFTKYSRFGLSDNTEPEKLPMKITPLENVEIVGNIFENPELLEVDDEIWKKAYSRRMLW